MEPNAYRDMTDKMTLPELCDHVIWQSVMEGTAHCGWTDRAREGLFESVSAAVRFAIESKRPTAKAARGGR